MLKIRLSATSIHILVENKLQSREFVQMVRYDNADSEYASSLQVNFFQHCLTLNPYHLITSG